MDDYRLQVAELLVRLLVGILFLFQGYDKLFKVKISGVINTFIIDAERNHIPHIFLSVVAYFTSIVEFLGGILLLLGFCTTASLCVLGFDVLFVSLAFTYMQTMWDMKFVLPRFAFLITLLLMPERSCFFSLDHLLGLK